MKVHGQVINAIGVVGEVPCNAECQEMRHWEVTYAPQGKTPSEVWESWETQHKEWVVVLAVKAAPDVGPPDPAYLPANSEPESVTDGYQPWKVQFVFRETIRHASALN